MKYMAVIAAKNAMKETIQYYVMYADSVMTKLITANAPRVTNAVSVKWKSFLQKMRYVLSEQPRFKKKQIKKRKHKKSLKFSDHILTIHSDIHRRSSKIQRKL